MNSKLVLLKEEYSVILTIKLSLLDIMTPNTYIIRTHSCNTRFLDLCMVLESRNIPQRNSSHKHQGFIISIFNIVKIIIKIIIKHI